VGYRACLALAGIVLSAGLLASGGLSVPFENNVRRDLISRN